MNESETSGYTVTYARDEAQFPVYVMAIASAALLAATFAGGGSLALILGVAAAGVAFFNYPLLETKRPRFGANQYGVFIEGFGIIGWRAIGGIDLIPIATRGGTNHELQIQLKTPLGSALLADWRKMPVYRLLMRLPWSMTHNNQIRINLEPFGPAPDEVHRTLLRMWKHYRS